ncbi:TVP38/TMEM64 family protein [Desulfohalovibrio reitneri]|uniref:TVP38/TMEM64 family protein n=1 Tax=Desulfohalovibrio reitneri TaxID=1307759 RepID=UPI0005558CC6|nr:TVP38/TMEM64 family protein [Desulfohalovibrio reitneri]
MTAKTWNKLAIVAIIAAAAAAFFLLDLHQKLTLENLKASRESLEQLYAQHTLAMLGGYFAVYVLMAALSLPGAAVMSLAGAAVFGFLPALVVVSFASAIGATLACAVARYLFRDWVKARFGGEKLEKINAGIKREGAFYLFTLRLIPVFPFFAINLVVGLTDMALRTFYWVSQVGMLPGTAVYVNAGVQLGQVRSVGDIFSLDIILSFAALGLFPLAARKVMRWVRGKRADEVEPETGGERGDG